MKKVYIVILQNVITVDSKHQLVYSSDLQEFDAREEAVKHGYELRGSDDFNIGVLEDGKMVSFDWMDTKVSCYGEPEDLYNHIAKAIGLEVEEGDPEATEQ